jgi:hypothetical protein
MTSALGLDLKKLKARAFDRADWAEEALRRYHSALQNFNTVDIQRLRGLYRWMFVPTTLWPFNVQDVLEDCLAALEKGKCLNSRHRLLIDLLPQPPDETICAAVHNIRLAAKAGLKGLPELLGLPEFHGLNELNRSAGLRPGGLPPLNQKTCSTS